MCTVNKISYFIVGVLIYFVGSIDVGLGMKTEERNIPHIPHMSAMTKTLDWVQDLPDSVSQLDDVVSLV